MTPFVWGLGATYDVHLRLIGKLVGNFLLVIIELFSLGAFVLSQFTRLTDRRTDGQTLIGKTALHTMQRGKNAIRIWAVPEEEQQQKKPQ